MGAERDLPRHGITCFIHWFAFVFRYSINLLMGTANYRPSATSNNMKLVLWSLMSGLLHSTARRGLGEATIRPGPSLLYQT